ncbi:MAG: dihydrolipoyl dehydrogenase [Treponemataceae bacterium]|nr:dihydrolipoyl dehydrogenase [Treponemataceae bacterium]
MSFFDVIILGGGPAGYQAAERLGSCHRKVLLVEHQFLGGTCLNVGCIPTKTLLHSAKTYLHSREAAAFGVTVEGLRYDWKRMQSWKEEVVTKLREGIAVQMKRCGVTVIEGWGMLVAPARGKEPARVQISQGEKTGEEYRASAVLVCTGSVPIIPGISGIRDNPAIVDSTGLLHMPEPPQSLIVIGGGVIGVEFASLFSALGVPVTVIEMTDEILPFMDRELAPLLRKSLKGVDFRLGCRVEKIEGNILWYTNREGKTEEITADKILVAVGRRPQIQGWGAETVGLEVRPQGIVVDERMCTNVPGIWAAGDVTGRSLLAHGAYRMADVAAQDILSYLKGDTSDRGAFRMRWEAIPWVVYGTNEAAGVGRTEQEAQRQGIPYKKVTVPLKVSGRFVAENGFGVPGTCKVLADPHNGRILGIHVVGPYASEIIWGAALILEQELRIQDVRELIFPHPTVSEVLRDAVWAFE